MLENYLKKELILIIMDLTRSLRNCDGKIPEGTFFADLSEEQIRAVLLQEELGRNLIRDCPEITETYGDLKNFRTLDDIGRMYLGENHSAEVRRHAVAYAVEKLVSSNELSDLRLARRRKSLESRFGAFGSKEFSEHCRKAAIKRNLEIGTDVEAMIKGRGRTPWIDEEKKYALDLSNNPSYQHQDGSHKGSPNYELIALELNIGFHECTEVRYANSVASFIRDTRRKEKT